MYEVTHDDKRAYLKSLEPIPSSLMTSEIPGAIWSGVNRHWSFPLTKRSILAFRKFLTGKSPITISPETANTLREVADQDATPDIVLQGDNIVITFESFEPYKTFVTALGATLEEGAWVVHKDRCLDVLELIDSLDLDLIVSPEVSRLNVTPIPGFDGTIISLKGVPLETLRNVKEAKMHYKVKRKTNLSFADRLRTIGINDLFDLALYFPLRLIDRSNPISIRNMVEGETYTVIGKIERLENNRQKRFVRIVVQDESGAKISATFFSQIWISSKFKVGEEVMLTGTYGVWRNPSTGYNTGQMQDARIDHLIASKKTPVIPIYPQSEKTGISTQALQRATYELFSRLGEVSDVLPYKGKTITYDKALRSMHFPATGEEAKIAQDRLIRDELFMLQLHILSGKQDALSANGIVQPIHKEGYLMDYIKALPYSLTGAQKRTLNEIAQDVASAKPMHRLLQGDVSSGKTTIAHAAVLNAVDNGKQGVIIAPTEILAEQLCIGLAKAMQSTSVRVEFLGTKTTKKNRESIIEGLADGSIHVLVGTHAILEKDVQFKSLSTVVIDEQHRFGTAQRSELKTRGEGGNTPDLLIMTATPIPRTGAMVLYGDLELSILDELPPGRIPITTKWIDQPSVEAIVDPSSRVWAEIREQVNQGRQAYVVTSLIEDSEVETSRQAASAESAYEILSNGVLHGLKLGLMHGRMKRADREDVMARFAAGEVDVLVATTVIEVGVNVPNATVIAVLDCGNFGISQLHQIRGRVGRASYKSTCFLVGDVKTPIGRARMEALVSSNDGFYLSERDLELRGEGEVFGSNQSGMSDLRLASIVRDLPILEEMKTEVEFVFNNLPWSQVMNLRNYVNAYYKGKDISS